MYLILGPLGWIEVGWICKGGFFFFYHFQISVVQYICCGSKITFSSIFFKPGFFWTSLYFAKWFVYQLSKKGFYLWGVVEKIGAWLRRGLKRMVEKFPFPPTSFLCTPPPSPYIPYPPDLPCPDLPPDITSLNTYTTYLVLNKYRVLTKVWTVTLQF